MARVSICLPPKRGRLKNGTNVVGRVHTHTQSSFNDITIHILSDRYSDKTQ